VGGQWGYVDTRSGIVLPIVWQQADDFSGGVARVLRDGVWSCLDRLGRDVSCSR